MKHGKVIGAFVVILVLSLSVAYVVDPDFLGKIVNLGRATTVSISQINVDPQGSIVGDEYKGSFWNILCYINANDYLAGVVLPKGQTGSVTYQGAIKALETGAKVEIKIKPQQAYLIRNVQEKTVRVAPASIGTVGSAQSELWLNYYDWGEATWRVYTPFLVTVYKDGVQVGQATLNMEGQSQEQIVSTPEGAIRIGNLGALGGNYLSPNTPSQIAIFKGAPNIYDRAQIYSMIDGSSPGSLTGSNAAKYSDYWYGILRDSSNRAINKVVVFGGFQMTTLYQPSSFGGWAGSDSSGEVTAVKPVIYSGDKSSLPSGKQPFLCLTEWLQSKGVTNLADTLFKTRSTGDSSALWQKASFVTDTNGQVALKLDVPWSAYGTPLVNIKVPTELADTWIERPIVTQVDVSAVWQSTGTKNCEVYGSNRIAVTLTNRASVTGSTRIMASSANSKLAVTPLDMVVNNLEPNVPQTVYFDATNLGVESSTNNIPITFTAYDTYTNSPSGSDTVYGTLMATLTQGQTTLHLRAVEKGSDIPIISLQLAIQYSNQAPSVFTNANGEVTLTLTTPQGGAYTGQVFVQSADTTVYKSASATYTLNNPTAYEFTLEVERKDTVYQPEGFNWLVIALIIGVIALIVAIIVLVVYFKKRRRR